MNLNISAVAFDIDGTLYPAYRFNLRILPFLLRNFKFMAAFHKTRKEIRRLQLKNPDKVHKDFFDFQAEIFSQYTGKPRKEAEVFLNEEIYSGWKKRFAKIKPYSFVREAAEALKKKGLKIGLLSDFLPEQKNDVWGILPLCDAAIGSEQAGALKPSVIAFKALAEKLGEPCESILYVGNNLRYDVAGANAAGMYTACIKNRLFIFFYKFFNIFRRKKSAGPDIYFSNYRQLLKFVL
ncbi:HAD family hydrolase [Treponema pedis]|uniref:HAD superfamily hydrolase n=2 Tax=Treponema pedis TaxID=409322 RepID=S5ZRY4_9SPIR|nr:HAD family hydrolase [Treponema pedis]AGT42815.1 HAD superfamily hydrolase [Treponema pedis str. T A4]QOW61436.1 HAD family hydrolase [Treponema pedis]